MKPSGIITLTTDFGLSDPYVAMMKGVILSINPSVRLVDVTHQIGTGSISQAALLIRETFPYFPEGTVHLAVVDQNTLRASQDKGVEDSSGWRLLSKIPVGANAVYFGITNDYTENKCIRINSDFRSEGNTKDSPYPGVDHAPAMPMEVLVINDGKKVKTVHYGQMWRMQLYFWDSGYTAFAKNTLVPSIIFGSIEKALTEPGS